MTYIRLSEEVEAEAEADSEEQEDSAMGFRPGDEIEHRKYGPGKVLTTVPDPHMEGHQRVRIEFPGAGNSSKMFRLPHPAVMKTSPPAAPPAVASILITPQLATLTSEGATQQFLAQPLDQDGGSVVGVTVKWSSSNSSVVEIDETIGLATAVAEGNVTVTAESGTAYGQASVDVVPPPEEVGGPRLVLRRAWGTPNVVLDPRQKKGVKDSLRTDLDAATVLEYEEIQAKFGNKNEIVKNNAVAWTRALASEMQVLLDLLRAHEQGNAEINERELKYISTVLIWYMERDDFIPDTVPGRGYLDDAHVFNLLVKHLRTHAPHLVDD